METPKTLVVTDIHFWQEESGNQVRIAQSLRSLSARSEVTIFIYQALSPYEIQAIHRKFNLANIGCLAKLNHAQFINRAIRHWIRDSIPQNWRLYINRIRKSPNKQEINPSPLTNWINTNKIAPDFAIFHYKRFHTCSKKLSCHTFIDTHDIFSARSLDIQTERITQEDESKLLSKFDTAIAISKVDEDRIRILNPDLQTITLPYIPEPQFSQSPNTWTLGFIGGDNKPNFDSLNALLAINQPHPIVVAGAICRRFKGNKMIKRLGPIKNLDTFYNQISCLVNLTTIRSGQKIKNIEALAYGKPIVTTTEGTEGVPDLPSVHIATLGREKEAIAKAAASQQKCTEAYTQWAKQFDYASLLSLNKTK